MSSDSPDPTILIEASETSLKEKRIPQEMCKKILGLPTVKLYEKGHLTPKSIDKATAILEDETLAFPIHTRQSSKQEIKEHHLDKLFRLSIKSIQRIHHLDEPSDEQKEWILFRLSHRDSFPYIRENKIGDYRNGRRS